jgi:hypothetical protein
MNVTFQSYKVWFSRIAKLVLTATSVGFWVHPTYLMFFFNPQTYVGAPSRRWEWNDWISHTGTYKATFDHGIESSESDESGYLTVCHGNHNLLIGKTSTNGPFSSIFHGYVSHNQRLICYSSHKLVQLTLPHRRNGAPQYPWVDRLIKVSRVRSPHDRNPHKIFLHVIEDVMFLIVVNDHLPVWVYHAISD